MLSNIDGDISPEAARFLQGTIRLRFTESAYQWGRTNIFRERVRASLRQMVFFCASNQQLWDYLPVNQHNSGQWPFLCEYSLEMAMFKQSVKLPEGNVD